MPQQTRRLAAILFSDIVAYTAKMGADEGRAIDTVKRGRRLQRALVERFHGEWVQEVGDGTLCTFTSAVDAVTCALEIQAQLREDTELRLRIGIHEGDIVIDGSDIYGDGVNIASRIHDTAVEGGICISEKVYDEIRNKPGIQATYLGARDLKNVDHSVRIYAIAAPGTQLPETAESGLGSWIRAHRVGSGLIAGVLSVALLYGLYSVNRAEIQTAFILNVVPLLREPPFEHEIGFTTTRDGTRIAYSTAGEGPVAVQVLGWFTHLEKGISSPAFSMAPDWEKDLRFVRFDGRGTGLSDRNIEDFSLDARVSDLEAVVDALQLERFSILTHSAGGPVSIAYTVRHPERVNRIAFYGSFARVAHTPARRDLLLSLVPMVRSGWGEHSSAFRQVFTSLFMPEGDELDHRLFNEWQRIAANPEDAANFLTALIEVDVRDQARRIRAPTLVVHRRGDEVVDYEVGRELASLIPGARLVTLEGKNHAFLRGEPEMFEMLDAVGEFFGEESQALGAAETR